MTQPPDLGRRGFFRTFAKDVVQTAGVALETVTSLNRAASEAAGAILRPSSVLETAPPMGDPAAGAASPAAGAASPAAEAAGPAAHRSEARDPASSTPTGPAHPFRVDGDMLFVLDESRLPDAVVEIECRSPIDVAREIARRTLPGGSVPGQAAAMSLALAASEMRGYLPTVRTAIMGIRASGLVDARPSSQHLRGAVARVMAAHDAAAAGDADGAALAAAVRDKAEAICREADAAVALIGERLVAHLPDVGSGPVAVLADLTGVPFLVAGARGRDLVVHVLEGGPERRGARVGSWLLARAGVDHAVVTDAAAGWLLGTGEIAAVVVGAECIAANGDAINDIGTYPLAVLAARHRVPVYVCGADATVVPGAADGFAATVPGRDLAGTGASAARRPAPPDEVTPNDLIAAIVTERGVLRPPFAAALLR